jgi:hypothetical protein
MSAPSNCSPCCSTTTTTQVPGPAGADATPIAPGIVDPNGNVIAQFPGQTYYNKSNQAFWIATAIGNASWVELIGPSA